MDGILIIIVVALVAVAVGAVCGYHYARMRSAVTLSQLAQEQERVEGLTAEREGLQRSLTEEKVERARLQEKCDALQRDAEQQRERADRDEERRREEFRQQLELVKSQLKNETQQTNRESITEILRPYREQLEELKRQSGESRATLETHIKTLVETGGRLSHEADRLARALSRDVRMQGNLGEKLLEDLLAGSGLKEGVQYRLQRTIRNADGSAAVNCEGQRMRPDAALYYPATNSVLYIDSKFQLPSDLDFENLDSADQEPVMKAFAAKIREQVKMLSSRSYDRSNDEGYTPLPYVIMFVPSETALMAVTSYNKLLWQEAFNAGVFIASERNLLMLIDMIRYMWQQQTTIDNHDEIVRRAEVLLDRVTDFVSGFDEIGNSLGKAVAAFETTKKKGLGPGQTISVAVRDLLKLGVKPSGGRADRRKKLQRHLVETGVMDAEAETPELSAADSAEA
ncbi:MAG: DNA recombination protein RmuC [Alistipes sp.]|nr:DNA recombination protein RmuC [Alistipes sp.]